MSKLLNNKAESVERKRWAFGTTTLGMWKKASALWNNNVGYVESRWPWRLRSEVDLVLQCGCPCLSSGRTASAVSQAGGEGWRWGRAGGKGRDAGAGGRQRLACSLQVGGDVGRCFVAAAGRWRHRRCSRIGRRIGACGWAQHGI